MDFGGRIVGGRRSAEFRQIELRANGIEFVLEWVAESLRLEKLDLRWNGVTGEGPWVERLEGRGCAVLV